MNKVILLEAHVIIDGEALLHQIFWSGSRFKEVINEYHRYVSSKYNICQIGFDGCKSKTTKDLKHARHVIYNPPCADVLFGENVNVLHSREELLSNSNNKHFRGEQSR